jgi:hypothetical protein
VILRRFGVGGAAGAAGLHRLSEVYERFSSVDYVPSNTKRYFLDYEGLMGHRTMQFRTNDATSDATAVTEISEFITAIRGIIYSSVSFTGLRVALKGSNVSNPVAGWTPILGSAVGTQGGADFPRYFSYVGRSTDGARVRLSVYGSNVIIDPDYRYSTAENATMAAGLAVLNQAPQTFLTISAAAPIWKNYANGGYNAYHQRKRRATA